MKCSISFVLFLTLTVEPFYIIAMNEDKDESPERKRKRERQEEREWARDKWLKAGKRIAFILDVHKSPS